MMSAVARFKGRLNLARFAKKTANHWLRDVFELNLIGKTTAKEVRQGSN